MSIISNNPWAGLASYQDPETTAVPLKFCGRDKESYDVAQLIDDNIFVTLYGKSGTGKTSLLNAGVFPRLRQKRYFPVSVRLGMDAINMSFQRCIIAKLFQVLEGKGYAESCEVVPLPEDESSVEYLWSFFARTRFMANDGCIVFPVIVLDQFEEVFRDRRQDVEALLCQIHFMTDESHALADRMLDGFRYSYDFNFRFVVAIREDDLYRLEDSIDSCYLSELKRCRYRLRCLSKEGAREAVLIPGKEFLNFREEKEIVNCVMETAENKEEGTISSNILSLICSRIYNAYENSDNESITLSLIEPCIKGNLFEQFYNEATRGLNNRERTYIEDHLTDSTGHRNSIPESDFRLYVRNGSSLLEGNYRILQRTSISSSNSDYRIELIHDSFCKPLKKLKQKRKQRKRWLWTAIVTGGLLILFIIVYIFYKKLDRVDWEMQENKARFVAEKALALVDNGDSCLAQLLALEILPENLKHPDKPYTGEAEKALRTANEYNTTILRDHFNLISSVALSSDGKWIVSCANAILKVWDAESGTVLHILKGHSESVNSVAFSHNNKTIVSGASDGTLMIWDAENETTIHTLSGHSGSVNSVAFSYDDKTIVSGASDGTLMIWDAENGTTIHTLSGHSGSVNSVAFSHNNKTIVSGASDGTLMIWDAENGTTIHTLSGHSEKVNFVALSNNDERLVSGENNGTIKIWDMKKGEELYILREHSRNGNSIAVSSDGQRLIFESNDNILKIWDFIPLQQLIDKTRERFKNRSLTPEESKKYYLK